ncbi:S-adenosyl-L-methionine-dependent methyltransferase [Halteromyces radiatus]|uniref:S-adenosyl-L-methionine-dependent methyltransferase n=1 Tax=Halteromyces radiatus TaxID=101107 RepID=UPI00221F0AF4|nr:S-adenosyl-L-methionine-dependent methyltransferase [Halteromyces radiatus]KAI8098811.1 S-adenosyl-L-methionine-dependent methyltransferase [Halteromyces radiatus]
MIPETILDVGTGNGIWAYEMAIQLPSTRVIGMGLRSVSEQPGQPSNLEYIQTDIHQPWDLASDSIDLIFQRSMGPTVTTEQWNHIISESRRVLKPGGYIEWVECDVMHHRPGPIQQAFDEFVQQEWHAKGMDFYYTSTFDQRIENDFDLELLHHMTWDIPIGEWHDEIHGKQLGFINQDVQKATYRNKKSYYSSAWSMTSEDYDAAVQALLLEFEEYKSFSRFHCWLARKKNHDISSA